MSCIRCFKIYYPPKAKKPEHKATKILQGRFYWLVIMHLALAVASLAFIGFVSMLTDMMLMTIAYSVYLYPKNTVCMLYLLLLVVGITWEIGDAFRTDLNKNGLQRTAKIVTAGIYGVQIFYTGQAWF